MKRNKEIITNRRHMHRYQQKYRLWRPIVMSRPILRINTDALEKWDEQAWLKHYRSNVVLVGSYEKPTVRILCGPYFQKVLNACFTNKTTQQNERNS